jgi:hypothetical protein
MKNIKSLLLFITVATIILLSLTFESNAQTFLRQRCPNSSVFQYFILQSDGNQNAVPCAGKDFLVNGVAIGGGGNISGNGTANYFPYFTALHTIADSPFSWDGTKYVFDNTALNAETTIEFTPSAAGRFRVGDFTTTPTQYLDLNVSGSLTTLTGTNHNIISSGVTQILGNTAFNNTALNSEFAVTITPSTTVGVFQAGDCTATITNCIDINQNTNRIFITSNANTGLFFNDIIANRVTLGAVNGSTALGGIDIIGNSVSITSNAVGAGSVTVGNSANAIVASAATDTLTTTLATWDLSGANGVTVLKFLRTLTAGGTTGDQTINQLNGSVNFAAGASALTVTNSTVSTTSLILAVAQTNDATCSVKNVVAGAGSFVINLTANCTAETKVAFWVTN